MKKRNYRALALCLVLLGVLPLTGCGGEGGKPAGTEGTSETASPGTEAPTEKETVPEPAPEPIENLFVPEEAISGWINGEGTKAETSAFCTTPLLYVDPGDVITFGAAVPWQGWHVVTLDFSEEYRGSASNGSGLTLTEAIDDDSVIFSYTVPDGIGYLRLVCDTKYRDCYLITKNRPFTASEYRDFFGMEQPAEETVGVDTDSVLYRKSALFCGDSIGYGHCDDAKHRAWAGRIGETYGMRYDNVAVSGWALSDVRGEGGRIIHQIEAKKGTDYDYVIIEGGVNDGMGINDSVSASAVTGIAPVGVISDSFDPSSFDKTTFAGALEEIIWYAKNTWKDAKVGYIITFRMPRYAGYGKLRDMEEYWQTALEICEKWDVSCLDLYHDAYLNDELLAVNTDRCSPDGVHPNAKGYEILAPVIAEWMEGMAQTGHSHP